MNCERFDIQISLAFIGEALQRVDVVISSTKGFIASVSFICLLNAIQDLKLKAPEELQKLLQNVPLQLDQPIETSLVVPEESSTPQPVNILNSNHLGKFSDLIQQIQEGLVEFEPVPCAEGVNGTYFLKNKKGKLVAVFKPEDEEVLSPNNSKSGTEKEDKLKSLTCLKPGEASKREVAAYLVDQEGFFGVPKTTLASITHEKFGGTKVGSLQEFVESDGASWDIGPSAFPVREVHKIGLLDLYIFNFDRHGGNILFDEVEGKLIPIDNGFSLPDTVTVPNMWFEWMTWSQSKKPFDEETLQFIERLDVDRDIEMLKKELGIRDECLRVMRLSAALLKKGASAGLTLHDLGRIICRSDPDIPSALETIYKTAQEKDECDYSALVETIIN